LLKISAAALSCRAMGPGAAMLSCRAQPYGATDLIHALLHDFLATANARIFRRSCLVECRGPRIQSHTDLDKWGPPHPPLSI
jgi:hypothetical protein